MHDSLSYFPILEMLRKKIMFKADLRLVSAWYALICSDCVKGMLELKSRVIHGCFKALSDVYLSRGVG